jgi:hypothetical protein
MSGLLSIKKAPPINIKLSSKDERVHFILRELDKIKKCDKIHKQIKMCKSMIRHIVEKLRDNKNDHLLQTTAIWALTSMFRMAPEVHKEVMLNVGVPTILHEILSQNYLTGSTRQYASELCFFLRFFIFNFFF